MEELPTIVLAIDGLRASALGAYGQTAYETPALDAFAAEARVYEWVYARTPDPADFYTTMAPWMTATDAVLVTEDPATTAAIQSKFSRVVELEPSHPSEPAATVDATSTAAAVGAMAEAVVEANAAGARLVWLHMRGFYGPWDAPAELMETLLDEDDPEVAAAVAPPDFLTTDEDQRFAASCRYAAQVMTLDACLGGWLDIVEGLLEGEDYRLVLLGLRGFPLGEHGRVGGADRRLFSEAQHTPLLIREPGAGARFDRSATASTLDAAVVALLSGTQPASGPVFLSSPDSEVVLTEGWLLRAPIDGAEPPELYVKPDDRWEQNDVASLEEDVVADLLAMLASTADSGVVPTDGGH
jgi:hypothetical protein